MIVLNRYFLLVGLLCLLPTASFAADDETDFKEITGFQTNLLPMGGGNSPDSSIPVKEYYSIWTGVLPRDVLIFKLQNALYKLKFYPRMPTGKSNPELDIAIKEFQKSLGDKPTGTLLMGQLTELIERVNKAFPNRFHPGEIYPEHFSMNKTEEFVEATGTWQNEYEKNEFPYLQTTNIQCFRESNICMEATSMILESLHEDTAFEREHLTVGMILWNISRWNEDEIVAENIGDPCVKASLFVNLDSDKVNKLYRFYPGENCADYSTLKPYMARLISGKNYADGYYKREQKSIEKYYNPLYVEKVNKLAEEEKAELAEKQAQAQTSTE